MLYLIILSDNPHRPNPYSPGSRRPHPQAILMASLSGSAAGATATIQGFRVLEQQEGNHLIVQLPCLMILQLMTTGPGSAGRVIIASSGSQNPLPTIYLSICLSIYLPTYLSIYLHIYIYTHRQSTPTQYSGRKLRSLASR